MDVRCERCRAQYVVDDDRVSEAGVAVTCSRCGYVFLLKKKALFVTVPVRPEEAQDAQPISGLGRKSVPPSPSREWRLRQAGGHVWPFKELTTLQKWIVERKVSRDDEISASGDQWRRLGDIPEFASFFDVVDAAERAAAPAQRPAPQAPPPAASLDEPAWAQETGGQPPPLAGGAPRRPKAKRGGSWLAVLALALAGGVVAAWLYLSREAPKPPPEAVPDAGVAEPSAPAEEPAARPREQARPPPAAVPAGASLIAPAAPVAVPAATAAPEPSPPPVEAAAVSAPAASTAAAAAEPPPAPDAGVAAPAPPPAATAKAEPAPQPAPAAKPAPPKKPAPRGARAFVAQARTLRERGRTQQALALYAQAIDLEPTNAAALAGRGACYLDLSEYPLAEANFRAALDADPKNAEALFGMAEIQRYMGKKGEAVTFYERFLAVHPDGDDAVAARNAISKLKE